MEYCGSGSLGEYVEALQGSVIDEEVLRDLLRSMANALVYLEGKQIVHRKVEPSSVLLSATRTFVSRCTLWFVIWVLLLII
jgi:serine/threonine protein kinase